MSVVEAKYLSPEELDDLRKDAESNLPVPRTYYPANRGIPGIIGDTRSQGRKTRDAIRAYQGRLERVEKLANTADKGLAAVERSLLADVADNALLPGNGDGDDDKE